MSELLQEQIAYYRARAAEYDEWWLKQGRYHQSEGQNEHWFDEGQVVRDALHALPKQDHILELAAGTGIWTKELLQLGHRITAVDASPEMIQINKAKLQSERVHYVQADLFAWQSEQTYDMIFFGFWLSHVPPEKLADFLARVSAMLKPEGHLFMVDSRRNIYGTATNQRVPTDTHIHQRILNDGSQYQIVKVFYEPDALQSSLAQVNIAATAKLTDNFFIYAHGRKANS